jgi:Transglycosylase SLT domain
VAALTAEPSQGAELRPYPDVAEPMGPWTVDEIKWLIDSEARAHRVSARLMHDIAWAESRYQGDAYNRRSGASGVFQFIPPTWEEARRVADNGFWRRTTVFHPPANISVAAWVMSQPYPWGTRHWGR